MVRMDRARDSDVYFHYWIVSVAALCSRRMKYAVPGIAENGEVTEWPSLFSIIIGYALYEGVGELHDQLHLMQANIIKPNQEVFTSHPEIIARGSRSEGNLERRFPENEDATPSSN